MRAPSSTDVSVLFLPKTYLINLLWNSSLLFFCEKIMLHEFVQRFQVRKNRHAASFVLAMV